MDAVSFLVMPSPLLPERTYEPLVAALREQGVDARIAPSGLGTDDGAGDLIRRWAALTGPRTVLVPHSNAGYLAPSVRALSNGVHPIVFLDAALPPDSGTTRLAPPSLRTFLADLADEDGLLQPWTRWWPREELDAVVPADLVAELDHDCPRLPLGYFDFRLDVPEAWTAGPNAYLAFGSTYAEELDVATAGGWPHAQINGAHLHFLQDPGAVAAHVLDLARSLG
ncbi:hypothetical protein [Salana multivorans]